MTKEKLPDESEDLRARLREAEEVLEAIRNGAVDAIVVSGRKGEQVYTLQAAEEPYRLLVESINEGALLLTTDGIILYGNKQFADMMGLPQDRIVGTSFLNCVSKDNQPDFEKMFRNGNVKNVRFQSFILTHTGERIPAQISISIAYIRSEPLITAVITSLMERKQLDEALRLSNEIMTNMSEGVVLVRAGDGAMVYANPKLANMFGYDHEELTGKHVSILNVPSVKSPEEVEAGITATLRDNDVWSGEVCNRRKDGTTFWGFWNVSAFKHPIYGDVWVGVQSDITDRKRAEQSLQESEILFRDTFEQAAVGMAHVSLEGRFIRINQRFCDIVGYERDELIALTFQDITHPYDLEKDLNFVRQALEGLIDTYSMEKRYVRKDGRFVWVNLTVALLRGEAGDPKHFTSVVEDISKRKRLEEELERHRRHLEEMVEERTEEIKSKNITLQELNATLRVLLKQREDDKKEMEERFVMNIRDLVVPHVEQLKGMGLDVAQQSYLGIIETHLREIATPLMKDLRQFNLTPKEMKVAALVRQGKSTKEIAELLGTAGGSIGIHRKHIRKKLGLRNRKANLQAHLKSIGE